MYISPGGACLCSHISCVRVCACVCVCVCVWCVVYVYVPLCLSDSQPVLWSLCVTVDWLLVCTTFVLHFCHH